MKIIFAGSPQYALAPLKALTGACEVAAVLTQPDKPLGRKQTLTPTPVKRFALDNGIPVMDFARARDHAAEIKAYGADAMITCAYGQILSKEILDIFPYGVWNLHASLLPKFRGASPIQSAILAGETRTGVTVMRTEEGLDTGDILLVKACKIEEDMTAGELSDRLSALSAQAATEAIELIGGSPQLLVQDDSAATYCKKINKAQARIDFSRSAEEVKRLINSMSPSPAAFAYLSDSPVNMYKCAVADMSGEAGAVIAADKKQGIVIACGEGAVRLYSAQFAGGKILSAPDIINGRKLKAGDKFD